MYSKRQYEPRLIGGGYDFEVAQEPRIEAAHVQVCNLLLN